jgi:hypothetical protein
VWVQCYQTIFFAKLGDNSWLHATIDNVTRNARGSSCTSSIVYHRWNLGCSIFKWIACISIVSNKNCECNREANFVGYYIVSICKRRKTATSQGHTNLTVTWYWARLPFRMLILWSCLIARSLDDVCWSKSLVSKPPLNELCYVHLFLLSQLKISRASLGNAQITLSQYDTKLINRAVNFSLRKDGARRFLVKNQS